MSSLRQSAPGRYRIIKDWFNSAGTPKYMFEKTYKEISFDMIYYGKEYERKTLDDLKQFFKKTFPNIADKFLEPKYRTVRLFKRFMRIRYIINKFDETLDYQLYDKYPECKELIRDIMNRNWHNESKYDIPFYNLFHDEKYKSIINLYEYLSDYEATHQNKLFEIKMDPECSNRIDVFEVYDEHLMNKPLGERRHYLYSYDDEKANFEDCYYWDNDDYESD